MTIGRAVAALRTHADGLIEKGRASPTTFPRLIKQQGLGQWLDKANTSRLLAIMDRLPEVQAWHATLTLKKQIAWASPDSIMRKCPSSTSRPSRGRRSERPATNCATNACRSASCKLGSPSLRKSWPVPAPPKYQMTPSSSDSRVWKTAAMPTPRRFFAFPGPSA